jgi:hypothetical protein
MDLFTPKMGYSCLNTLGPLKICTLDIFLGQESPCLIVLFTTKNLMQMFEYIFTGLRVFKGSGLQTGRVPLQAVPSMSSGSRLEKRRVLTRSGPRQPPQRSTISSKLRSPAQTASVQRA